jgi:hypothetical protein
MITDGISGIYGCIPLAAVAGAAVICTDVSVDVHMI